MPFGHMDGLIIPLREINQEVVDCLFGLGIGDALKSSLGVQFMGHYCRLLESFSMSSATRVLLWNGVLWFALTIAPVAVRGSSRAAT